MKHCWRGFWPKIHASTALLATTWTVPLLTAHLGQVHGCMVSERTLRRRLHEYGWRWKRPRYVYHERAAHVAQKKGRLSAA
jgi:transposase